MKTIADIIEAASKLPVTEVWSNGRGKYWLAVTNPTTGEFIHASAITGMQARDLRIAGVPFITDRGMSDLA